MALTNDLYNALLIFLIVAVRIIYSIIISQSINCAKKTKNALTFLSFPFPIIIGIICLFKYKKNRKSIINIFIGLSVLIVAVLGVSYAYLSVNNSAEYYDRSGNAHKNLYDVVFYDTSGNEYTYNFDKSGYDKLYINSTDKALNADLCYLNENGYLYYDRDLLITANGGNECIDTEKRIFYPIKYSTFNKDGTINCHILSENLKYDRYGKAYTSDSVPYYDRLGNKYIFSFDTVTQKGSYMNLSTSKKYDSEYSYVDKSGFFVYDSENSLVLKNDDAKLKTYTDKSGNIYYKAYSVIWNGQGKMD